MLEAISLARRLELIELSRAGTRAGARRRLAYKLQIAVCTFENIIYGRIKRLDATLRDKLRAALADELNLEIMRLQHELAIARQGGAAPDSDEIAAVENHIAKAKAILKRRG